MSDIKWIKITTDIFDDEKMYAIETQQDGHLMELIWFKLLCLAGKCNNHGFLMLTSKLAYTDEMLSKIFRIEVGSIQRALLLFEQLEMIEVVDNAYMIANWDRHQNTQGLEDMKEKNRIRQQRFRDKQKQALLEDSNERNVTNNVTNNVKNNVNCSYSYSISNSLSNSNNKENNNSNKDTKKNNNKYIYYPEDEKLNSAFSDFVDMRKKIKAPMTDRAIELAKKKLDKLTHGDNDLAIEILNQSIMNSWKGLFELKQSYKPKSNSVDDWLDA